MFNICVSFGRYQRAIPNEPYRSSDSVQIYLRNQSSIRLPYITHTSTVQRLHRRSYYSLQTHRPFVTTVEDQTMREKKTKKTRNKSLAVRKITMSDFSLRFDLSFFSHSFIRFALIRAAVNNWKRNYKRKMFGRFQSICFRFSVLQDSVFAVPNRN